jgi:copper transport protein
VIAGVSRPAGARPAWLPGLLAVGLALALGLAPRPASAHATILSTTPRPGENLRTAPGVVVLSFSQPLDIRLSRASVVAPNGERFDQASVSPAEIRVPVTSNAPGVYQVSWTSVSAVDGHTLSGGFRFGVGVSPGTAVDAPLPGRGDLGLAILRTGEFAGLLLAVGLVLLLQLAALEPRLGWVRAGLPVVLAATAAAGAAVVLGEALLAAGGPSPAAMAAYLGSGAAGWTRVGRVAAEVAAVLVAARWPRLAAVPLGAALVALAAAGHAAAVQPAPLGVAVTVLHLASAGLWAGGILALAVQRPPGGWRAREGRRLLARFSPVAVAAFTVTAATGVLQGAEELSGLRDLVATAYGQVLSLKVLAVLLMVPLSVLAWRRIRPIPRVEAVLALVVVGASALLAAFPLPPARLQEAEAAQAGPQAALALPSDGDLTMSASAGDVLVGLTLRPGRPGRNTAWLYVLPIGGEQAASDLAVTMTGAGRAQAVRRCGPACRAADVDVVGGESLAVGVRGAGTAAFRVPALPAPDAGGVVERAQELMHALRTYRLDETLRPAKVPLAVTYAFQAPDRLEYQVRGGGETVIVGPEQFSRDGPSAPWRAEAMPAVQVPTFIWDGARVVAPRALTAAGDGPLQVVSFYEALDGLPVWFELSVDARGLVVQAAMRAQAHFMTHRYYDFDAPLSISPPAA